MLFANGSNVASSDRPARRSCEARRNARGDYEVGVVEAGEWPSIRGSAIRGLTHCAGSSCDDGLRDNCITTESKHRYQRRLQLNTFARTKITNLAGKNELVGDVVKR